MRSAVLAYALVFAAACSLYVAACIGPAGARRLHPTALLGAEAACGMAQAACVASGQGSRACAGVDLACLAGVGALRVAVAETESGVAVWWCVPYDAVDVENPEDAIDLGDGQVAVCFDDASEAADAMAELED